MSNLGKRLIKSAKEARGINGLINDPHLIMEVRPGGATRRANAAEHCAGVDSLTFTHGDGGEVAIARRDAVAVVDLDHLAVAALPAGECHRAEPCRCARA